MNLARMEDVHVRNGGLSTFKLNTAVDNLFLLAEIAVRTNSGSPQLLRGRRQRAIVDVSHQFTPWCEWGKCRPADWLTARWNPHISPATRFPDHPSARSTVRRGANNRLHRRQTCLDESLQFPMFVEARQPRRHDAGVRIHRCKSRVQLPCFNLVVLIGGEAGNTVE